MLNLFSSGSRGHAGRHRRRGTWLSVVAVAGVLALGVPAANAAAAPAGSSQAAAAQATAARTAAAQAATAAQTTKEYVIRFWPRYITFGQQAGASSVGLNTLTGVAKMGPQFRIVNLINNDTVYASGFVDLRNGPVVVTIPPTTVTYSILALDVWGDVIPGIPAGKPGPYALVLKGWKGTLPPA